MNATEYVSKTKMRAVQPQAQCARGCFVGSIQFAGRKVRYRNGMQTCASSSPRVSKHNMLRASLIQLPTGASLEVIEVKAQNSSVGSSSSRPPLLLLPGSLHAAWCWFLFQGFFRGAGYDSYAVSLRSTGKSVIDENEPCLARGTIALDEHLDDLDALLDALEIPSPVVIGHSMGGFVAQHWAQRCPPGKLRGMVLMCSKPPYGNNRLTWRIITKSGLRASWRLTMGFTKRTFATDLDTCREFLFSPKDKHFDEALEGDSRLLEYMQYFREEGGMYMTRQSLNKELNDPGSMEGKTLVMGAAEDRIVDNVAIAQTAEFFGQKEGFLVPNAPHELLLCTQWQEAAGAITKWLETNRYCGK